MSESITVLVESEILPGRLDALRDVVDRVIAHCSETEPGMLEYAWFVDEAAGECRVVETYADSDAVLFHFQNYAPFTEGLATCRTMKRLQVLGASSEKLTTALQAMSPPVFRPFRRFDRPRG